MSYVRLSHEAAYRAALAQVLERATQDLCIFDHDLLRMHLDAPDTLAVLLNFLAATPSRPVRIALHDDRPLREAQPRLRTLFSRYPHAVNIRRVPEEYRHLRDAHLLADRCHGVRRFHADHPRGALLLAEAGEVAAWWSRFDELWSQCEPVSLGLPSGL